jgi:hypothetical protein
MAFVAAWNSGAGDFLLLAGRASGSIRKTAATPSGLRPASASTAAASSGLFAGLRQNLLVETVSEKKASLLAKCVEARTNLIDLL